LNLPPCRHGEPQPVDGAGAFRDWICQEGSVTWKPGDTLVLVSDGVTEAGIDSSSEFGDESLLSVLHANLSAGAETLVDSIREAVARQTRNDATAVALRGL
jgi:serine phosphatase RsbU (regulator of sigma subunit)